MKIPRINCKITRQIHFVFGWFAGRCRRRSKLRFFRPRFNTISRITVLTLSFKNLPEGWLDPYSIHRRRSEVSRWSKLRLHRHHAWIDGSVSHLLNAGAVLESLLWTPHSAVKLVHADFGCLQQFLEWLFDEPQPLPFWKFLLQKTTRRNSQEMKESPQWIPMITWYKYDKRYTKWEGDGMSRKGEKPF